MPTFHYPKPSRTGLTKMLSTKADEYRYKPNHKVKKRREFFAANARRELNRRRPLTEAEFNQIFRYIRGPYALTLVQRTNPIKWLRRVSDAANKINSEVKLGKRPLDDLIKMPPKRIMTVQPVGSAHPKKGRAFEVRNWKFRKEENQLIKGTEVKYDEIKVDQVGSMAHFRRLPNGKIVWVTNPENLEKKIVPKKVQQWKD